MISFRSTPDDRASRYVPLDELLERPRVRILRTLQRHDWMTTYELCELLNVPEHERNTFGSMVNRLARLGLIDRRGARSFEYRINAAGRGDLIELLARSGVSGAH